jgi:hypothetical protein
MERQPRFAGTAAHFHGNSPASYRSRAPPMMA